MKTILTLNTTLDDATRDALQRYLDGGPPPPPLRDRPAPRAVTLFGERRVRVEVPPSGRRPLGASRARWAGARRVDTWRRRRDRRHGYRTRPRVVRVHYPAVAFIDEIATYQWPARGEA